MAAQELKPCPFCGASAQVGPSAMFSDAYQVVCANGHTDGFFHMSREDAVAAWNRRFALAGDA